MYHENDNENTFLFASKIKSAIRAGLAQILSSLFRSRALSIILLLIHLLELFAQSLPSENHFHTGLMPAIHTILSRLNMRGFSDSAIMLIAGTAFILNFVFLACFSLHCILHFYFKNPNSLAISTMAHFICAKILIVYNYVLTVPFIQIASLCIVRFISEWLFIVAIFLFLSTTLISFSIIHFQINFSFSLRDHLMTYPQSRDYLILTMKIGFSALCSKENDFNLVVLLIFLMYLLIDYFIRITFCDRVVSRAFFSALVVFGLLTILYILSVHDVIDKNQLDISYLGLIGCPVLVRSSWKVRHKLVKLRFDSQSPFEITREADIDLLVRELKHQFKLINSPCLSTKSELISVILEHMRSCINPYCSCHQVNFEKSVEWRPLKPVVRMIIGGIFKKTLSDGSLLKKSNCLLNYCAFIADIEKVPNKALNFLFKNKAILKSFKNKLCILLLNDRCKQILEKNIKRSTSFTRDYSEIMEHEINSRELEKEVKILLLDHLQFLMVLQNKRSGNTSDVCQNILRQAMFITKALRLSKKKLAYLLNQNPENLKLLQISIRLSKVFDEDPEFRNFIRMTEMMRIHSMERRNRRNNLTEEARTHNIFEPGSGVIYLNLTDKLGRIEKISAGALNILDSVHSEVEGRNISNFMPQLIGKRHDQLLENFIQMGKLALLRSEAATLYAVSKDGWLVNVQIMIRVDTHFSNNFMVAGLVSRAENRRLSLICDEIGNILHVTRDLDEKMGFSKLKEFRHCLYNICIVLPQLFEFFFPENELDNNFALSPFTQATKFLFPTDNGALYPIYFKDRDIKRTMLSTMSVEKKTKNVFVEQILLNLEHRTNHFSVKITSSPAEYAEGTIKILLINFDEIAPVKHENLFEEWVDHTRNKILDSLKKKDPKTKSNATSSESLDLSSGPSISDDIREDKKTNEKKFMKYQSFKTFEDCEAEDSGDVTPGLEKKLRDLNKASTSILSMRFESPDSSPKEDLKEAMKNGELVRGELPLIVEEKKSESSDDKFTKRIDLLKTHDIPEDGRKRKQHPKTRTLQMQSMAKLKNQNESQDGWVSDSEEYGRNSKNIKVLDRQSESGSSINSNSSLKSTIENLKSMPSKGIQTLLGLKICLFLGILSLIVFCFVYNTTSLDQVKFRLESSLLVQDLLQPMSALMRSYIIDSYLGGNSVAANAESIFTFSNYNRQTAIEKMLYQFSENMRKDETSVLFLHQNKLNLRFPKNVNQVSLDLERTYGLLLNCFRSLHGLVTDTQDCKIFLEDNYVDYVSNLSALLELLNQDIRALISKIETNSLYIVLLLLPFLTIFIAFVFYKALVLKVESTRFASALLQFSKEDIFSMIRLLEKHFKAIYPKENLELQGLPEPKKDRYGSSALEKKNPPQTKSKHTGVLMIKINSSHLLKKSLLESKSRSSLIKRLSFLNNKAFFIFLVITLTISYVLPLLISAANYAIMQNFKNNVISIIYSQNVIQAFSIGVSSYVSLKHLEYFWIGQGLEKEKEAQILQLRDFVVKCKIMSEKSPVPGTLLNENNNFKQLIQLNSEFFFTDMCSSIDGSEIYRSAQKENQFLGFSSCDNILKQALTRGSVGMYIYIDKLFVTWDYIMSQNKSSDQQIFLQEEFRQVDLAIMLLEFLEEIKVGIVRTTREDFLEIIIMQQKIWIGIGLPAILLTLHVIWLILIGTMGKTHQHSFVPLDLFSSKIIINNKVLVNRIHAISRKNK